MNNTTTANNANANTNDWCDACTTIGGYCGGACNGAYEWYKGYDPAPRIITFTETGRIDNSLPHWSREFRIAFVGSAEHYREEVANVAPHGFDIQTRIKHISLAFKRGMKALKIKGHEEAYPEIPLSREDLERVLDWVARHPEADVAFVSRPRPHHGGYEWKVVPPLDEARGILREMRANEKALTEAGVEFSRRGFIYSDLHGWRGVIYAKGHHLEFRGFSENPCETVKYLCRMSK